MKGNLKPIKVDQAADDRIIYIYIFHPKSYIYRLYMNAASKDALGPLLKRQITGFLVFPSILLFPSVFWLYQLVCCLEIYLCNFLLHQLLTAQHGTGHCAAAYQ